MGSRVHRAASPLAAVGLAGGLVLSAVVLSAGGASAGSAGVGGPITQGSPTAGSTSTAGSSTFADQLATSPGADTFETTSAPNGVTVSSSGAVATTGLLAAGDYTVSGTDEIFTGDLLLGAGTWSYTLSVSAVTIVQSSPTSKSTGTGGSSSFTDRVSATAPGTVAFATTSAPTGVLVSSDGAVTTTGALGAGDYAVSGTDSDGYGDSGTWSYTLTVVAPAIITVTVSGHQSYGSSTPTFSYTDDAPAGVSLSATLTCSTVGTDTPIAASLPSGSYTVLGSSCSGLSAAGDGFTLSYQGDADGFTVTAAATPGVDQPGPSATTTHDPTAVAAGSAGLAAPELHHRILGLVPLGLAASIAMAALELRRRRHPEPG